jgi:CspA family cold shock protein
MPRGTVKWFDLVKGYGFITRHDEPCDVFVHITTVRAAGLERLQANDQVEFAIGAGLNGKPRAVGLRLLENAEKEHV